MSGSLSGNYEIAVPFTAMDSVVNTAVPARRSLGIRHAIRAIAVVDATPN
jgi:hypothetical protein